MERPELSVVIPIFNEAAVIDELRRRLADAMERLSATVRSWEVIFIDDGSRDSSLEILREMARIETRFKVVSFARNFGHQLAITAGIDLAEGDAVVIMDADLQDPPEVVVEMIERWRAGFDVVYAVRKSRAGETVFKRLTAAAFYRVLRWMLGGVSIPADAGDFRLMSRSVILTLRALRERHRFVRGMVAWVGFKQTPVYYDREARFAGETKYPFSKMLRFAVDAITSFSILPLRMASWLGVGVAVVALVYALYVVYVKLVLHATVPGWATLMIAVALGTSAQLFMTGILGEYVGRIYEEVKRRPLYITAELLNFSSAEVGPSSRHARSPVAPSPHD
jgi:polyisoprenyl-phosphate glycosyltransferase